MLRTDDFLAEVSLPGQVLTRSVVLGLVETDVAFI